VEVCFTHIQTVSWQFFEDNSQGSVTTCVRCDGIYDDEFLVQS